MVDAARRSRGGGQRRFAQGSVCLNPVRWTDWSRMWTDDRQQRADDRRDCAKRALLEAGGLLVPPARDGGAGSRGEIRVGLYTLPGVQSMDVRYMSKKREVSVPAGAIEAKDWRLASSSLQADLSAARTCCGGRGSFWLAVLPKGGTHMASRRWPDDGGRRGQGPVAGPGGWGERRGNRTTRERAEEKRQGSTIEPKILPIVNERADIQKRWVGPLSVHLWGTTSGLQVFRMLWYLLNLEVHQVLRRTSVLSS